MRQTGVIIGKVREESIGNGIREMRGFGRAGTLDSGGGCVGVKAMGRFEGELERGSGRVWPARAYSGTDPAFQPQNQIVISAGIATCCPVRQAQPRPAVD